MSRTRLRKLGDGEADATLLALAGLNRLGMADKATRIFEIDEFLPAVGQGAIAIESRRNDDRTNAFVAAITDPDTEVALTAERSSGAARRLLPHTDRRPLPGERRADSFPRPDHFARRQGVV